LLQKQTARAEKRDAIRKEYEDFYKENEIEYVDHGKITKIASLYSKTNEYGKNKIESFVNKQIESNNLIDASIKKAPTWFTTRGLQLPKVVQTIIDANNSISQKTDLSTQNSKIVLEDGKASQDLFEDMDEVDTEVAEELSPREMLANMLERDDMSPSQKGFLTKYKNKIAQIEANEQKIAFMILQK
jgi:hypothetical protein